MWCRCVRRSGCTEYRRRPGPVSATSHRDATSAAASILRSVRIEVPEIHIRAEAGCVQGLAKRVPVHLAVAGQQDQDRGDSPSGQGCGSRWLVPTIAETRGAVLTHDASLELGCLW